jgi:electron transfer flavoprotein alpha/beta subunit
VCTKEHKRKEIQQIDIAELELKKPDNRAELLELQPVPEKGEAKMLEGDSHEVAVQLLKLLRDGAKVL